MVVGTCMCGHGACSGETAVVERRVGSLGTIVSKLATERGGLRLRLRQAWLPREGHLAGETLVTT